MASLFVMHRTWTSRIWHWHKDGNVSVCERFISDNLSQKKILTLNQIQEARLRVCSYCQKQIDKKGPR